MFRKVQEAMNITFIASCTSGRSDKMILKSIPIYEAEELV